jgi:hypothetical protein
MKVLPAALIAFAGLLTTALPVAAQTEITVFGGIPDRGDIRTVPPSTFDDSFVNGPVFDPGGNFDPAQAAINALNVSHFFPRRGHSPFNFDRALTLNATGESLAEHQLRCQDRYDSYDLVSDTYLSSRGIPVPCR